PRKDIAPQPEHGEVRRFGAEVLVLRGLDAERADIERTHLPGQPGASEDLHGRTALETDPTAVEQVGCSSSSPTSASTRAAAARAEVEDPSSRREGLALLRVGERELLQVHLVLIDLDLCEVSVDGEVRRQVLRVRVLDVEGDVAVP